jgi:hypothetical protein
VYQSFEVLELKFLLQRMLLGVLLYKLSFINVQRILALFVVVYRPYNAIIPDNGTACGFLHNLV